MTLTLGRITHHNTRPPATRIPGPTWAPAMSYLALITRRDGTVTGKHIHAPEPGVAAQVARGHLEAGETLTGIVQGQVWLPDGRCITSRCPAAASDQATERCMSLEGARHGHDHPAPMYRHRHLTRT